MEEVVEWDLRLKTRLIGKRRLNNGCGSSNRQDRLHQDKGKAEINFLTYWLIYVSVYFAFNFIFLFFTSVRALLLVLTMEGDPPPLEALCQEARMFLEEEAKQTLHITI